MNVSLPRRLRSIASLGLLVLPVLAFSPNSSAAAGALKRFPVTEFGAIADGTTLNTAAIQKAIDTAAQAGGGVVELPRGTFKSGAIFLKNGVELHLAEGAVLLGSTDIEDYPKRETRIEGHFEA